MSVLIHAVSVFAHRASPISWILEASYGYRAAVTCFKEPAEALI